MFQQSTLAPVVWCLLSAGLFGASTPACKWLVDDVPVVTLAGLLYLGAALATAPFVFSGGKAKARVDPSNVRKLLGAIAFGGVLGPLLLLFGLERLPSISVSLWLNLETTATAILALLLFREHLSAKGWLANLLFVLAGVALAGPSALDLGGVQPGVLLLVLACICWGLDNNLTAVIDGYTPAQTTFAKGLVAGAFNLILGCWFWPVPDATSVLWALLVGALAYGLSIVLYIRGAQQLGATRSQMLFSTAPLLGIVAAWVGLGEPMLPSQWLAGLLVLIALGLLATSAHVHRHDHDAQRHTHPHRHDDGHHNHHHHETIVGWHTHEHEHEQLTHVHAHVSDLHHRHDHGA